VTAEVLNEKFQVPYLIFEGDMADPRQYAENQVKNRVDAFLEILSEK
jgi:benzoyl-CoA reductase/2-hydroxyglutaryl-CoA dehydratase subunit BcrC/BadD/HgdB